MLEYKYTNEESRHLLGCASKMMTVKQVQAQGTSLPLCRSCRDKLGQQSTGESAETAMRDTLEKNRTFAKKTLSFLFTV
jgi:ribosome-binding protein aMBF1 (putative translation factor)